jgi:hypothetical protein
MRDLKVTASKLINKVTAPACKTELNHFYKL